MALDQAELKRRWRAKYRAYLDAQTRVTAGGLMAARWLAASCRDEPFVPCPFCLQRPQTTASGTCGPCARERGLATGRAGPLRTEDEPRTKAQVAAEDADRFTPDEVWFYSWARGRVVGVPRCEGCGRLLLRPGPCWWCQEQAQRAAEVRAHELARKLRTWERHKAVYSARARARREARKAEAAV